MPGASSRNGTTRLCRRRKLPTSPPSWTADARSGQAWLTVPNWSLKYFSVASSRPLKNATYRVGRYPDMAAKVEKLK